MRGPVKLDVVERAAVVEFCRGPHNFFDEELLGETSAGCPRDG
jgi:hypothetical protein